MSEWSKEHVAKCTDCGKDYPSSHDNCPNCEQPQAGKTMYISLDGLIEDIKAKQSGFGGLATASDIIEDVKKVGKSGRGKHKVVDDIEFESTTEANRYIILRDLQIAGIIRNLKLQPYEYELHPQLKVKKNRLRREYAQQRGKYTPDFSYDWQEFHIIEDVKDVNTKILKEDKRFVPYADAVAKLKHKIFCRSFVYTHANYEFFITVFDKDTMRWRYFFNGSKELVGFDLV